MNALFVGGLFSRKNRHRRLRRIMEDRSIRACALLPNGRTLWGVLQDISQEGVRISGDTTGLSVNQEVGVILAYPSGAKVKCRCQVKHIDDATRCWGAEMVVSPLTVEGEPEASVMM